MIRWGWHASTLATTSRYLGLYTNVLSTSRPFRYALFTHDDTYSPRFVVMRSTLTTCQCSMSHCSHLYQPSPHENSMARPRAHPRNPKYGHQEEDKHEGSGRNHCGELHVFHLFSCHGRAVGVHTACGFHISLV